MDTRNYVSMLTKKIGETEKDPISSRNAHDVIDTALLTGLHNKIIITEENSLLLDMENWCEINI